MEIKLTRAPAAAAISVVSQFTMKRPDPFCYLLLRTQGGRITATANGEDGQATIELPGAIAAPGHALVRGEVFAALMHDLAHEEVSVKATAKNVNLYAGKSHYRIGTIVSADGLPDPFPVPDEAAEVNAGALLGALQFAFHAAARLDVRYYLNGVHLRIAAGHLLVAATDGHRAAYLDVPIEAPDMPGSIIPYNMLRRLLGVIPANSDKVLKLHSDSGRLFIGYEGFQLHGRLIEGNFPDIKRLIPEGGTLITVQREALAAILGLSLIVMGDSQQRWVRLTAEGSTLRVAHEGEEHGQEDEIACSINEGRRATIAVNAEYLVDAIKAIGGDSIQMAIGDREDKQIRLQDPNKDRICIMMPVRA